MFSIRAYTKGLDQSDFAKGFILLGLTIPFSISISRYVLIGFFLISVLLLINGAGRLKPFTRKPFYHYLIPLYFIACAISLLHGSPDFAWLERGWMLLVFPILLLLLGDNIKLCYNRFIQGFIAGSIIVATLDLFIATFRSVKIIDGTISFDSSAWGGVPFLFSIDHYGNFYFSEYLSYFSHPTYAALMMTLAVASILCLNPLEWRKRTQVVFVVFLVIIILLLSSRAGFIGLFVSLLIFVFFSKQNLPRAIRYISLITFVAASIAISFHPRFKNLLTSQNDLLRTNTRIISWQCAIEGIRKDWIFGVGLHRVQPELNKLYKERNHELHFAEEFNVHNQFLETWFGVGIFGIGLLVLIFVYGFKISLQHHTLFEFLLIVNLFVHFVFESMLIRFHGNIIFALFIPFLLATGNKKT